MLKFLILFHIFFKLDPPIVRVNSSLYTTTKGNTVQLFCIVDANPIETKHITWKLNNKPVINVASFSRETEQRFSHKFLPPNLSILTISNAKDSDDGNFSCQVSNLIGLADTAYTELRVKRPPQILTDLSLLKAAQDSNTDRTATFICKAKAFPDVSFKWRTPSNIEIYDTTGKYTITNSKIDSQVFQSMLQIHSVELPDQGSYSCEARNEIGITAEKAILSGKRKYLIKII